MHSITLSGSDAGGKYLGWNIGGTASSAIVGNGRGVVIARRRWPSNVQCGPTAMLDDFCAHAHDLLREHDDVLELGISVGGPLDTARGLVLAPPHLPGWENIDLHAALRRRLPLPVTVEHDAVACLLAEHLWGAARHATHAIYLTCGTGFGAGIMIDGRILRGPAGQTPEVGHIRLSSDGPDMYGKPGCVESFCSGNGIARLAHHLFPAHFSRDVPVRTLAQMTERGDERARQVLLESARRTGHVCAMLGDIFSPQIIILGSLARYLPDWWLDTARAEFASEVLGYNGGKTQIVCAATGADVQDLSSYAPCVFNRHKGDAPPRQQPPVPRVVVSPAVANPSLGAK